MKKTLAIMMVLSVALCSVATADDFIYQCRPNGNLSAWDNITALGPGPWSANPPTFLTIPTNFPETFGGMAMTDPSTLYVQSGNWATPGTKIYTVDTATKAYTSVTHSTAGYALEVAGDKFYITTATGVQRIASDGTTEATVAVTGWAAGAHTDIEVVGDTVYFSGSGSNYVWTLPTAFTNASTATVLLDRDDYTTELGGARTFQQLDTDGSRLWVSVPILLRFVEFDISGVGTPTHTATYDGGGVGSGGGGGVYDVELGPDGFLYGAHNNGVSQWNTATGLYTGNNWINSATHNDTTVLALAETPIPEPAGLGLLGLALLGLRKRRN